MMGDKTTRLTSYMNNDFDNYWQLQHLRQDLTSENIELKKRMERLEGRIGIAEKSAENAWCCIFWIIVATCGLMTVIVLLSSFKN